MKKKKAIVQALRAIQTTKYKYNLYKDVVVGTLDADLTEITQLFAFWAVESEEAQAKFLQKEIQLKRLYAKLDLIIRKKMNSNKIDKLTEGGIRTRIIINDKYKKLEDEMMYFKFIYNKLNVARQAMSIKKDVLQSIAANRRKERDEKSLKIKA